jgi:hypothetical protein
MITDLDKCSCGRLFDCTRCGHRVHCTSDVNHHKAQLCRACCAADGIRAINQRSEIERQPADITRAPAALGIASAARIGTIERQATEDALNAAWASGHLTDDVHQARMTAAAAAVTQADLDLLTADLLTADPGRIATPRSETRPAITRRAVRRIASVPLVVWVALAWMIIVISIVSR